MGVYFFHGDEDYNIELEINKLKKKLLDKNFASMNFKTVDNPNFGEFIALLRTQPMMFGNMMVVINIEDYFSKALEDNEIKQIEQALEDNIETLCVVLVVNLPRDENKKVDSRRKIFKVISKHAQVQEFPTIKSYNVNEIASWIQKEAKKYDISFEQDAALSLVEQVGNNLRQLSQEIQKLKLFAHPEKKITQKMVREISISNEDLFAFADLILKGERCKALIEFQKLIDKKHSLEVLSALQTMLKGWIYMKLKSKEMSMFELSKKLGQHEYRIKLALEKMRDTPLKDLVQLKQNLTDAEYKIKSGQSLSDIAEVEKAILSV